jgi:hypothetical protein
MLQRLDRAVAVRALGEVAAELGDVLLDLRHRIARAGEFRGVAPYIRATSARLLPFW